MSRITIDTGPPQKSEAASTKRRLQKGQRGPTCASENHRFRVTGQAPTIAGLVAVRCALSAASWEWLRWLAATRRAAV